MEKRNKIMSGIKGKNTKPELIIRKNLFKMGFRYRIHVKGLPGNPDIVIPKYKAIIQINGCFWHGHKCHLFKWPQSNSEFWFEKINCNVLRDDRTNLELDIIGWRTLTVWECALKGKNRIPLVHLLMQISEWIINYLPSTEIPPRLPLENRSHTV